MNFSKNRMARLSGLLREGKEEEADTNEAEETEGEDVKEADEVDEADHKDETYEVDETDVQEIEESLKIRRLVRGELEQMWASGQVFGKKSGKPKGITMGFTGIGFKR